MTGEITTPPPLFPTDILWHRTRNLGLLQEGRFHPKRLKCSARRDKTPAFMFIIFLRDCVLIKANPLLLLAPLIHLTTDVVQSITCFTTWRKQLPHKRLLLWGVSLRESLAACENQQNYDALSPITFPIHIKRIVTANKQNWKEYKKRASGARILSSSFFTLSGGVAKAQVVIVSGKRPVRGLEVFLQHFAF